MERHDPRVDVRVLVLHVGVLVVGRMLFDPHGVAHAHQQRPQYPRRPVVGPARSKHLMVGGFVGKERELGKQQTQDSGYQQLKPRLAQQHKTGGGSPEEQQ